MTSITISRENLKNALRPLLQASIKRRVEAGAWTHVNRDSYFSPSQWWVDALNGNIRHSLETGISATMNGNVISVKLAFTIIDISPS